MDVLTFLKVITPLSFGEGLGVRLIVKYYNYK